MWLFFNCFKKGLVNMCFNLIVLSVFWYFLVFLNGWILGVKFWGVCWLLELGVCWIVVGWVRVLICYVYVSSYKIRGWSYFKLLVVLKIFCYFVVFLWFVFCSGLVVYCWLCKVVECVVGIIIWNSLFVDKDVVVNLE